MIYPAAISPGDSPQIGALTIAANWAQDVILGTTATTTAIIAVSIVGLMLLSGRIDVRRAATVLIGCFVLFGAPVIGAGIMSMLGGGDLPPARTELQAADALPLPTPAPRSTPYDPYAGASVPSSR
jgi:type IV secretion system protein VirB2